MLLLDDKPFLGVGKVTIGRTIFIQHFPPFVKLVLTYTSCRIIGKSHLLCVGGLQVVNEWTDANGIHHHGEGSPCVVPS